MLSLVVLGLWLGSGRWSSVAVRRTGPRIYSVWVWKGLAEFTFEQRHPGQEMTPRWSWSMGTMKGYRLRWWFVSETTRVPGSVTIWNVGVPIWVVLVLVGLPTALLWRADRHRGRAGICGCCGYAVAGLLRCPECGATVGAGSGPE